MQTLRQSLETKTYRLSTPRVCLLVARSPSARFCLAGARTAAATPLISLSNTGAAVLKCAADRPTDQGVRALVGDGFSVGRSLQESKDSGQLHYYAIGWYFK